MVDLAKFKKMFFTFFKGESKAFLVFDKLWPCICEFYDFTTNQACTKDDPNAVEVARISQLTSFIDLFNYYPMQVCKVRYKNDSNELTYVMNSGLHGSKNDKGEVIMPKPKPTTSEER